MERVETYSSLAISHLKATFGFVLLGIAFAAIINFLTIPYGMMIMSSGLYWGLIITEFAVIFAFMKWNNIYMYLLFTGLTGATLAPAIGFYLGAGMAHVVVNALLGTLVMTGGLGLYAITTKRDFMRFGPILFWAVVGLVVVSLINIFLGSPILALVVSGVAVVVFSLFIVHDIQQVLYTDIAPLDAAMGIYLSILNLFVSLLQIFGILDD